MDPNNNTGTAAPAATTSAPKPDAAAPAATAAPVSDSAAPTPASTTAVEAAPSAPATPAAVASETLPPAAAAPASTPAAEAPKTPESQTILGTKPPETAESKPATENKPADQKPAEQPKAEGSPSAEPAPLPTYEKFTLPEGIQVDEVKLGEFTKDLGEFESANKVEHTKVQEFAQKLVNRYVTETQDTVTRVVDHYNKTWEKQKNEWREAFIADSEMGGNRQETTVKNLVSFVDEFGGDDSQKTELRKFMDTGIGNKPELIRLMNNAAQKINAMRLQYETETNNPLPGRTPESPKKSKTQTLYGKTAGQNS